CNIFLPSYTCLLNFVFFFTDTATTVIYTLSLHDALPICHIQKYKTCPLPLRYPHLRPNKTHHYLLAFRGQPTLSFRRQRFYIKDWAAVDTPHYTIRSIAHYHKAFFQNEEHASVHLPNSVQIRPRYGRKSLHWQFFPM